MDLLGMCINGGGDGFVWVCRTSGVKLMGGSLIELGLYSE